MPSPSSRPGPRLLGALLASLLCLNMSALAQNAASDSPVENSRLDAQLFYQLLIGEIELREGAAGTAYDLILDAARKTRDEQLFRRATEIALQARAAQGEGFLALRIQRDEFVVVQHVVRTRRCGALRASAGEGPDRPSAGDGGKQEDQGEAGAPAHRGAHQGCSPWARIASTLPCACNNRSQASRTSVVVSCLIA
mgnify:CR=1 FL=1